MADPHNPARAEEVWDPERVRAQEVAIRQFKDLFTVSGGWAWHFMSPPGHKEYKTQHDHKDIDAFVKPERFVEFVERAKSLGYERADTLHDDPSGVFYRYTKRASSGKIVLDIYVQDVPSRELDGICFVDPPTLLKFYETTHSSKECWAVKAATKLVASNIDPVLHPTLVRGTRGL
jgi:hypothetical protein